MFRPQTGRDLVFSPCYEACGGHLPLSPGHAHLYEARENPGNTKIKHDTKQGHQPLAVCEDLAETKGTRVPFVIEKLELKKPSINYQSSNTSQLASLVRGKKQLQPGGRMGEKLFFSRFYADTQFLEVAQPCDRLGVLPSAARLEGWPDTKLVSRSDTPH